MFNLDEISDEFEMENLVEMEERKLVEQELVQLIDVTLRLEAELEVVLG